MRLMVHNYILDFSASWKKHIGHMGLLVGPERVLMEEKVVLKSPTPRAASEVLGNLKNYLWTCEVSGKFLF